MIAAPIHHIRLDERGVAYISGTMGCAQDQERSQEEPFCHAVEH